MLTPCLNAVLVVWQAAKEVPHPHPDTNGTPAYRQALYLQKQAQEAASQKASIELAARTPGHQPSGQLPWQLAATKEQLQQLQVKCIVIKSLLQLSPLVAEESMSHQTDADSLLYEVMSGNAMLRRNTRDVDDVQTELRQLCMASLASLAVQPQSINSLLSLPTSTQSAPPAALQQGLRGHEHILLTRLSEVMEASLQPQQVIAPNIAVLCISALIGLAS